MASMRQATEVLEHKLERQPTDLELSEFMNLDIASIDDLNFYSDWSVSLDEPTGEEGAPSLLEKLWNGEENAEHELVSASLKNEINSLVQLLPDNERQVIEMTYGFNGYMFATDIGGALGISAQRVSQVRSAALKKLREYAINLDNI